jgi:hypothetical protein
MFPAATRKEDAMRFLTIPQTGRASVAALAIAAAGPLAAQSLAGDFEPVNSFGEEEATGQAVLTRSDQALTITVSARGLTPGMHLMHLHGFEGDNPVEAMCPGMEADANGDGYVDLIETREAAGVTMIPLTQDPASLTIQTDTYPTAREDGSLDYVHEIEAAALEEAVREKFGSPIAAGQRVVVIHGAPEGADLPDSVQSLDGVPARVTIPIACAELDES